MNNLEELNIFYLNYNQLSNHEIKDFSHLGIIARGKLKLCSILYTSREIRMPNYKLFVNKKSFVSERISVAKYVIEELFITNQQLGKSYTTTTTIVHHLFTFIDWVDSIGTDFTKNTTSANKSYMEYTAYLRASIRSNKIGNRSAETKQSIGHL